MRGKPQAQADFLIVINLNQCAPADHPLPAIRRRMDAVLQKLSPLLDDLYEELGRFSISPEQRLRNRSVQRQDTNPAQRWPADRAVRD